MNYELCIMNSLNLTPHFSKIFLKKLKKVLDKVKTLC